MARNNIGTAETLSAGTRLNLDCTKSPWQVEVLEDLGATVRVRVVSSGQTVTVPRSTLFR